MIRIINSILARLKKLIGKEKFYLKKP